jgi:hypothetical protein
VAVSKRAAATATLLALLIGLAAGIAWHEPKGMSLSGSVRTWVGFVVVIVGAAVALWQLDMQRRQLRSQQQVIEDEVKRNMKRDELVDGQLDELEQRKRVLEREQADKVGLSFSSAVFESRYIEDGEASAVDPGVTVHMAVVSNESHRSIRDVKCRWGAPLDDDTLEIFGRPSYSSYSVVVGRLANPEPGAQREELGLLEGGDHATLIRARQRYGFVFEIPIQQILIGDGILARFTDDAGLHWQIDHDMHLKKLDNRDDW